MPWRVQFEATVYPISGDFEIEEITMTIKSQYGEMIFDLGNLENLTESQGTLGGVSYTKLKINDDLDIDFYNKNSINISLGTHIIGINGFGYEIRKIYNIIKTLHSTHTLPNEFIEEMQNERDYQLIKSKPFYLHAPHEKGDVGGTGGARKRKTRTKRRS